MTDDPLIGTKLDDRYEIVEVVGKGAMGVVYRARQLQVGRDVAVKVLGSEPVPEALSRSAPERFEKEARIISQLRHPNTVKMFDFGRTPDGQTYLVMEYLSGKPLSALLEEGPLGEARTLAILRQVADSLAEAHQLGIVHRDLKPSNVFVDRVGGQEVVKVLDFGIAKTTKDPMQTETGAVLGTPAYMSPEQALGENVSPATDVYSLGVLAYHCLAGRPPFEADTPVALLVKHVNDAPPGFGDLDPPPTVTEGLAGLIFRMLAKNPTRRPSSGAAVRAELESLAAPTATGTTAPVPSPGAAGKTPRRTLWIALPVILLGLIGALLVEMTGKDAPKRPPAAVPSGTPAAHDAATSASLHQLTDSPQFERQATLSADGSYIAYVAGSSGNADIFLRRVEGQRAINLTEDSDEDDLFPAFSPDGKQIAFVSLRDGPPGLYLMGTTGESVRRIADRAFNPAWTPDGKSIVFATAAVESTDSREGTSELGILDVETGEQRTLFDGDAVQPSVSPHGKRIAYGAIDAGGIRSIWTIGVDGDEPVPVIRDAHMAGCPAWSPDGSMLYYLSNRNGAKNLWRVRVDEETGAVEGPHEPVTAGISPMMGLALSRDGKAVSSLLSKQSRLVRLSFDPEKERLTGQPGTIASSSRGFHYIDPSPDGRQIVFTVEPREQVVIMSSDGTGRRNLTDATSRDRRPLFSPDGSRVVFYSMRSGHYEAWLINADGTGLRQATDAGHVTWTVWTPDGRGLLHWNNEEKVLERFDLTGDLPVRRGERLAGPWDIGGDVFVIDLTSDGKRLLAKLHPSKTIGVRSVPVIFDLEQKEYEVVEADFEGLQYYYCWLADDRRVLFLDKEGLVLSDLTDDRHKLLRKETEEHKFTGVAPSPVDPGLVYLVEMSVSSDLWLVKLE